jgi:hypothetical protein
MRFAGGKAVSITKPMNPQFTAVETCYNRTHVRKLPSENFRRAFFDYFEGKIHEHLGLDYSIIVPTVT